MARPTTWLEVCNVLSELDHELPDVPEAPFWSATGMDSLDAVEYVSALESLFGVEITDDMVDGWTTGTSVVEDIDSLLEAVRGAS